MGSFLLRGAEFDKENDELEGASMNEWIIKREEPDLEVLEESALAMAQATIQKAIDDAGLSRSELSRRMHCPRSFVSRMLGGNHNLTVRTMARALLACGFEIGFERQPIVWNWLPQEYTPAAESQAVPATAGTAVPLAA
jgi:hypothetical protein